MSGAISLIGSDFSDANWRDATLSTLRIHALNQSNPCEIVQSGDFATITPDSECGFEYSRSLSTQEKQVVAASGRDVSSLPRREGIAKR